jgi:DNA-binding IclR family transcriptional regulator
MLQSVSQALRLLKLFERSRVWGVTSLSQELGLSTSTIHRLLNTLVLEGFVEQLPSKKYQLVSGITFSSPSSVLARCVQVSDDHLRVLRDNTEETVHLAVLSGLSVKYVAAVESNRMMKVTSRIGKESPAHATAVGKLLLSYYGDSELERLYRNRSFEAPTDRALGSFGDLLEEVHLARENHFARNVSESEVGLYSIAVPIHGLRDRPVCGLSLSGPLTRIDAHETGGLTSMELALKEELERCAQRIEEDMAA